MIRLGLNVDHVATLRQQRKEGSPDPIEAALIAQRHGANSIVAHLREDRRHIQDRDLERLKKVLRVPLAMEMAATKEMTRIALRIRPERVCLVPEKRQELTTEGGLNVVARQALLRQLIPALKRKKIEISLFVDPALEQIRCAKAIGADTVELHTGRYANLQGAARKRELARLKQASALAKSLRLNLHAGHGLDYENVERVARIAGMQELNIGFSIISRAIFVGIARAVKDMKETMLCAVS